MRSPHRIRSSGLQAVNHFQFFDGIAVVRCWCEVSQMGKETQTIQYVSTFNLNGVEKERDFFPVMRRSGSVWYIIPGSESFFCRNIHFRRLAFRIHRSISPIRSSKAFELTNTGNWSTKHYLPMGYISNTETGSMLFWQIEHTTVPGTVRSVT